MLFKPIQPMVQLMNSNLDRFLVQFGFKNYEYHLFHYQNIGMFLR